MDDHDPRWPLVRGAAFTLLASIAGTLGFVMRQMHAGERVGLCRTLIEGASAGFVGLMMMYACHAMGVSDDWTAVTVGVSGWLGAAASIQMIQRFVWQRIGLSKEDSHESDR
jgi:hypothetical protein